MAGVDGSDRAVRFAELWFQGVRDAECDGFTRDVWFAGDV